MSDQQEFTQEQASQMYDLLQKIHNMFKPDDGGLSITEENAARSWHLEHLDNPICRTCGWPMVRDTSDLWRCASPISFEDVKL